MRKKNFLTFALTVFVVLEGSVSSLAADVTGRDAMSSCFGEWILEDGSCGYPLTPKDPEWATMSYAEQLEACNMPQELVEVLSTEELVKVALDYPLMLDCLLFDSYEDGIKHLISVSNVYRELFERENVGRVLVRTYSGLEVDYNLLTDPDLTRNLLGESGYDKEIMLQLLLSSNEIMSDLDQSQTLELTEVMGEKYEEKKGYVMVFKVH